MSNREDQVVTLTVLSGAKSGRRARLATAGVLLALTALVGAGVGGRLTQPAERAGSSQRAAASTSPGPHPASGTGPALEGVAAGSTVVVPQAGYRVAYAVDGVHGPSILDNGALATFGFGPPAGGLSWDGTIQVAVGTPARGVAILGRSGPTVVFGRTLEELRTQYLEAEAGRVVVRSARELGGELSVFVRVDDGAWGMRAVALVVHGGRNFVLTATGFGQLYGDVSDVPAEVGLDRFAAGFSFGTSLFVSQELGFQAPLPIVGRPFGVAIPVPSELSYGLFVFADGGARDDGGSSHSIGVSVGTRSHPALVRVLPSSKPPPQPRRIWASSLVELQAAYLAAIGRPVGSSTTIWLGGELALLLQRPDGLATAVLAVHRSRGYLLETTGADGPEPAPHFEDFLAGFIFLD